MASYVKLHDYSILSLQSSPPGDTLNKLQGLLNSLAPDSTSEEIDAISDLTEKSVTSKKVQEGVVNALMTKCQDNWQYSYCAAQMSSRLAGLEVEGVLFRAVLLSALQANFKGLYASTLQCTV